MIEKELIEKCRQGDLHDFRKIIEKTIPVIFPVALRILGDEDTAKDVVQEIMVTIWQKVSKIKTAESYSTWAYRIIMNKCYDHLRRQKHRMESRIDEKAWTLISNHLSEDGTTELENSENALIMNFLTNKLSLKQKAVFVLSEIEELPAEEVAKITGISRSAVKANLYHARINIKSLLEKYL